MRRYGLTQLWAKCTYHVIEANLQNHTLSSSICDRCNGQLQIPLIDGINLRQHQQSKSYKAIAAKVKASASQPKITTLLRHMFASPAASDATAAAVQPVTPISSPSSTSINLLQNKEIRGSICISDGYANGASDLCFGAS